METTIQALGRSLEHWQALYIISLVIGALSTFWIIIFALHVKESKMGLKISNYVYLGAAWLAVISTVVIIAKTRSIDTEKDKQVELFQSQAAVQIQQLKTTAEEAKLKAENTSKENALLRIDVLKGQAESKKAEAALATQNQQTNQFAHALQMQQENMAQQMHVSPVLSESQIVALSNSLKPFSGQDVIFHTTLDTTVLRLSYGIIRALDAASVKHTQNSMDAGAMYQGVSVVIHQIPDHPPLADALISGLTSAGIIVHPVVLPDRVPDGRVAIFLGPN